MEILNDIIPLCIPSSICFKNKTFEPADDLKWSKHVVLYNKQFNCVWIVLVLIDVTKEVLTAISAI
jgi:hypothetical protein